MSDLASEIYQRGDLHGQRLWRTLCCPEEWRLVGGVEALAGVTILVALVSEIFVESVQEAAVAFGMTQAFVGFIVVALECASAEMASPFRVPDVGPAFGLPKTGSCSRTSHLGIALK